MINVLKLILLIIMLSPVLLLVAVVTAHGNWPEMLLGALIGVIVTSLLEKP